MMRKHITLLIWLLVFIPVWSGAQDKLPVPGAPESWVNDYGKVFSKEELADQTKWVEENLALLK